jgi:hypothetical protein
MTIQQEDLPLDNQGLALKVGDFVKLVNNNGIEQYKEINLGDEFIMTGRFDDNIIQVRSKEGGLYGFFSSRFILSNN